jgi:isoleucyl-tRNA synthetase
VLVTLSKLCAPFIPFLAEEIYQNLVVNNVPGAPESVHLCDFPVADKSKVDPDVEEQMDALVEAIQLGRACRNTANLKVRQPVRKLYVKGASFDSAYQELCEDELNVKEVIFTEDARAFTTWKLKPQMRTLGPRFGKLLGKIGAKLNELDGNLVVDLFNRGEELHFELDGTPVSLSVGDVLTEPMQKPGFTATEDRGVTVVLDTNLTDDLVQEGYAREVISKLQTMRKEAGFAVTDRIQAAYTGDDELAAALEAWKDMICRAPLATALERKEPEEGMARKEWDINGKKAVLGIRKN